jgi:hypothetical protein
VKRVTRDRRLGERAPLVLGVEAREHRPQDTAAFLVAFAVGPHVDAGLSRRWATDPGRGPLRNGTLTRYPLSLGGCPDGPWSLERSLATTTAAAAAAS